MHNYPDFVVFSSLGCKRYISAHSGGLRSVLSNLALNNKCTVIFGEVERIYNVGLLYLTVSCKLLNVTELYI